MRGKRKGTGKANTKGTLSLQACNGVFKGVPLMGKQDFVFFEGEYLKDYTLWNPIV